MKIRCPYCDNLYDEKLDKCPHCLGKKYDNKFYTKRALRGHLDKARDLKTGEFLQQYGSKITFEKVPLFQSPARPKPYIEPQKPKKPALIQRIIKSIKGEWKNGKNR